MLIYWPSTRVDPYILSTTGFFYVHRALYIVCSTFFVFVTFYSRCFIFYSTLVNFGCFEMCSIIKLDCVGMFQSGSEVLSVDCWEGMALIDWGEINWFMALFFNIKFFLIIKCWQGIKNIQIQRLKSKLSQLIGVKVEMSGFFESKVIKFINQGRLRAESCDWIQYV